jgi:hypothetical protein
VDKRRVVYTIRFVIAAWLAIAGLYGIVKGIYYLSGNNATATIIAAQVVFYSGMFAFMGWQMYKRRGRRNWRRSGDTWKRSQSEERDEREEQENGWKQQKPE